MGLKILILDDSDMIRNVVRLTLSQEGHEITEACDGVDGLKKLDGSHIDLCICDVNMPEMDGLTFLHTVKNDAKYDGYKFMPVIMLTTESGPDMKEKGKVNGAGMWLIKPFQPAELIEAVNKLSV